MSDFLKLIKSRRSIRDYEARRIERPLLERCVEAARLAPSACNAQPWKFIIVDDPGITKSVAQATSSGVIGLGMNSFARGAAAFIVLASERGQIPFPSIGATIKKTNYTLIDIGIACEHIVLAATELGIGTCILGWFDEKKIKKILMVPALKRIELVIAMGYPTGKELKERKLKDASRVFSYNKY